MAAQLALTDDTDDKELEQGFIDPDFKPVRNKNVHPKAKKYHDAKALQDAAKEVADEAHDVLLEAMIREGLETYAYKGTLVRVNTKKKVKVKMKGEEDAE